MRMMVFTGFLPVLFLNFLQAQEPEPIKLEPAKDKTITVMDMVHTEIVLFLKNGDKVKGIVRNNHFREKVNGKDFALCKEGDAGAGLRLWFVGDTKSYVFFPERLIQKYTFVRGLTDVEFREIATRLEKIEAQKKAAQLEEKKAENPADKDKEKDKAADANKKEGEKPRPLTPEQQEAAKKLEEELKESFALLEKFPPEDGWGVSKIETIRQRRVNDIYPTKDESEFERNFDKWKKAFDIRQEELRIKQLEEEKKKKETEAPPKKQDS